jgi:hypothetical protein
MISIYKILNEITNKKLKIFDFDDTLIISNSKIYVTHKDGKTEKLSTEEYANYKKRKGDNFDYSEFKKIIQPKQIKYSINLLKKSIDEVGKENVVILTARSHDTPIKKYLYKIGLLDINIVALGDSNPIKKAN